MATELAYYSQSPVIEPQFRMLDQRYCEAIVELEKICYPAPWSPELIRGEFAKDISLRCGLITPEDIIAYSFSYLAADELHVLNLAVNPKFRSRGYGRRLLKKLMHYAHRSGARFATLEVRQSNYIAKRLYASLGFEVLGLRKNYYRDNQEHALVLQCELARELTRNEASR